MLCQGPQHSAGCQRWQREKEKDYPPPSRCFAGKRHPLDASVAENLLRLRQACFCVLSRQAELALLGACLRSPGPGPVPGPVPTRGMASAALGLGLGAKSYSSCFRLHAPSYEITI